MFLPTDIRIFFYKSSDRWRKITSPNRSSQNYSIVVFHAEFISTALFPPQKNFTASLSGYAFTGSIGMISAPILSAIFSARYLEHKKSEWNGYISFAPKIPWIDFLYILPYFCPIHIYNNRESTARTTWCPITNNQR